jgi:adenylate cyclase
MDTSSEVPAGEISCIFTDITHSTNLWEYNEAGMSDALKLHNKIMRREIELFGGYEIKTLGDGFHITFTNAASALRFCLSAQLSLHSADWPQSVVDYCNDKIFFEETHTKIIHNGLGVRMGIHYGKPYAAEINCVSQRKDIFGSMVNISSRVQTQAAGGEIAISDAFILAIMQYQSPELVDGNISLTDDLRTRILSSEISSQFFEVKFMGDVHLKGVLTPIHITLIRLRGI